MQIYPYVLNKIGRSIAKGLRQMSNKKLTADTRLYAEKGKQGRYGYERAEVTASKSGNTINFLLQIDNQNGRSKIISSNAKDVVSEMKQFAPMSEWRPLD
jgi:hypothetical protein